MTRFFSNIAKNAREGALAAGLLAMAAVLRVDGIWFGFPILSNLYIRPDESLSLMGALDMLQDWGNPHYFGYPGLLMAIWAALLTVAAWVFYHFGDIPAPYPGALCSLHTSACILLGRMISVVAGVALVAVVGRLGLRWRSRPVALGAMALLATAPLAAREAHFATTDTLVTLGIAFFLLAAMEVVAQVGCEEEVGAGRTARPVLILGATLGLAASAKYSAASLAPVIFLAAFLGRMPRRPSDGRLDSAARAPGKWWAVIADTILAGLAAVAVFLLANPWLPLEWETARAQLGATYRGLRILHMGRLTVELGEIWRQFAMALRFGPGELIGLALVAWGVIRSLTRVWRSAHDVLLLAILGCLAGPLLISRDVHYRYTLPLNPLMALLAADGLWDLIGRLAPRRRNLAYAVALGLVMLPGAIRAVWVNRLLARPDTRVMAGDWIAENVPIEAPIVILGYPECEPQLLETVDSLRRRAEYAVFLYGPDSGEVVARPFVNFMKYRPYRATPGYEVYRNPHPRCVPASTICRVIPEYPLDVAHVEPAYIRAYGGTVIESTSFRGLNKPVPLDALEPRDAFFLPFTHLWRVERPGPNLRIEIVRWIGREASNS